MKSIFWILLLATIAGCGRRHGDDFEYGYITEDDYFHQYLSGSCGVEVLMDHNSLMMDCHQPMSRARAYRCEIETNRFLDKYAGINCYMNSTATTGARVYITDFNLRELRSEAHRISISISF